MQSTVVTPSPGFISIAVQDAQKSASFYERYLGAMRDTFDFGPDSAVFVGWRAWGAVFGSGKAGCGSGCGSCGANRPSSKNLLSIEDRS